MDYIERIIDINSNEETIRPYTQEEILEVEANKKTHQKELEAKQREVEQKEQARAAILDKLGITEEEAKLLLS